MNRHSGSIVVTLFIVSLAAISLRAEPPAPAHWKMTPTPPMGWNSYDAYGDSVTEAEVLANARYQKEHLLAHGYTYVVIDYRWYDPGAHGDPNGRAGAELAADEFGRLLPPTNRFPSAAGGKGFKPLADQIHAMGLKFGIHVMRGIPRQAVKANTPIQGGSFKAAEAANTASTCPWCPDMFGVDAAKPAGQAWYDSILRLYAGWGVDYIKVDDLSSPYAKMEIEAIRGAIDRCSRAIVFSTSPGDNTPVSEAAHLKRHANMWRIGGDIWDNWPSLTWTFDLLAAWKGHAGPGHWPDADMLPLGRIGMRGGTRWTNLSKDEQVMMMTLWAIAPSPLILGMNMPENDAWTLSLLTNDEVLAVDQDPLGCQGVRVVKQGDLEVWAKDLSGGAKAVAMFNRWSTGRLDDSHAVYKSPLLTWETPGQSVEVRADIAGAKKLYLVVDDGDDDFQCDHADWIEPKLIGPQGERKLTSLKWNFAIQGCLTTAVGKSASGRDLIVGGKTYADGIGTHAQSIIEYDLPEGYTQFTARAGLDEGGVSQLPHRETVHFLVYTSDPRQHPRLATVSVPLQSLGLSGPCRIRDLWQHKDQEITDKTVSRQLPAHGSVLLKLQPGGRESTRLNAGRPFLRN